MSSCSNTTCPLVQNPNLKFCPDCGKKNQNVCPECKTEGLAGMRFCPECGTALAPSTPPTTPKPPEPQGRGLSPEEIEIITRSLQTPSKTKGGYGEQPDSYTYREVSVYETPDKEILDKVLPRNHGRIAQENGDGAFVPGNLSSDRKIDPEYFRHVRVIEYRFDNPTHPGRETVGPHTRIPDEEP